jgi:anti-sigma B factor antagonist
MEFTVNENEHCDLLTISGRIDSYTSPRIKDALNDLISKERCNIVVDLAAVTYLSSSGMLTLINGLKHCQQSERGNVVLVNVSGVVLNSLKLAGFDRLFEIYDDVMTAIERFQE